MQTREVGTVLWFNNCKGYGFIKRDRDKEDLFAHFRNIRGSNKRDCSLSEGDIVTFITQNEKDREIAGDIVAFDRVEARESRLTVLLGIFKPAGVESQLQQSFLKDSIFEQTLIPMIFEYAGILPKK